MKYPVVQWRKVNFTLIKRSLRHFWQYVRNGFSNADIWDLNSELTSLILPRLKSFQKNHGGYPGYYSCQEDWDKDISYMVDAFELLRKDMICYTTREERKIRKGLNLFAKRYSALWY